MFRLLSLGCTSIVTTRKTIFTKMLFGIAKNESIIKYNYILKKANFHLILKLIILSSINIALLRNFNFFYNFIISIKKKVQIVIDYLDDSNIKNVKLLNIGTISGHNGYFTTKKNLII
jgi:hypothetical protein